jgi:hypothetical protein
LRFGAAQGWDLIIHQNYEEIFTLPGHPIPLIMEDFLLDPGPNHQSRWGTYPFMGKRALADQDLFQIFRAGGADYSLQDGQGYSALHWAAYYGLGEVLDWAPELRGILDLTNIQGQSALHLAVAQGHFALGLDLVNLGLNPGIEDTEDRVAMDYFHPGRYTSRVLLLDKLKSQPQVYQAYLEHPILGTSLEELERDLQESPYQGRPKVKRGFDFYAAFWTLGLPSAYFVGALAHREGWAKELPSDFFSQGSAAITLAASTSLLSLSLFSLGREASPPANRTEDLSYALLALGTTGLVGILSGTIGAASLGEAFNENPFLYYLGPTILSLSGVVLFSLTL